MREDRDVVVVGAGPAGSAAATFLRQAGHDVLLLDEARFPRDKVCGESVSPEAHRLLDALGAASGVAACSPQPLLGMVLTAPDGTRFRGDYRGGRAPGFALRRQVLDERLLAAARRAGVEIREGVRVTGLVRDAEGVRGVRCGDGRAGPEIGARLVIGADGRCSVVARALGLLREHGSLRKFAVRGYWTGVEGLEARGEMHVGAGGYCGVAPLGPGLANVAFVLDRREMRAARGGLEAFYRARLARWRGLADRLSRATLLEAPRAVGPLALEASGLSAPGALLVGDAAGFYDPFTGEGVTLALRSAEIAAAVATRALGSGRSRAGDLTEYDRRRHAATRDKFRFNRLLQRVVAWPDLANAVARRLARRPDLADRLVGVAGDFVPAREAWRAGLLWDLILA